MSERDCVKDWFSKRRLGLFLHWQSYMAYLLAQVRELCTNYGEIRHFFWDINVPGHKDPEVNEMLRGLQPNMVINNRGFDDGDFGTPEREYEKYDTDRSICFDRHSEACNSVGTQSWGYRKDEDYYSSAFLIQSIDALMAKGAHYLLNAGPDATGRIPDVASAILLEIGAWYSKVSEAFSDTQPCSNLTTNRNVFLTRRANTLYVHLRSPITSDAVLLPPLTALPIKASLLNTGDELECSTDVLPAYWKNENHVLRVRGLPRETLGGDETLVIRLDFESDLNITAPAVTEFQG